MIKKAALNFAVKFWWTVVRVLTIMDILLTLDRASFIDSLIAGYEVNFIAVIKYELYDSIFENLTAVIKYQFDHMPFMCLIQ